jgi:hypothetical protein
MPGGGDGGAFQVREVVLLVAQEATMATIRTFQASERLVMRLAVCNRRTE